MPLSKEQATKILSENEKHVCPEEMLCVRLVALAELPSRFGNFQVAAFHNNFDNLDHAAFLAGDVYSAENVPVRLHSECLTGDVAGSLRCDCREQLEAALDYIGRQDFGILLYLRQEGRGIGLSNKIKAYALQEEGLDTFDANRALGFREDERDYRIAAHMLSSLKVRSIKLLTNNPNKIKQLTDLGISVVERIPLIVQPNEFNRRYLETKASRGAHLLGDKSSLRFLEQMDELLVDEDGKSS
ncbi:MAG: GTP cyclohydrolase II [candidate division Zixibacteria bacterium]|nr:GTP cyclohydrolase II [candidate division Zixibacteria bacterium]MCI0596711.1 GTP cyclohydrolase II [candidate division Zixibacteria bacterium]